MKDADSKDSVRLQVDPGVKVRRRISFESTKLIASSQDDVNVYTRELREFRIRANRPTSHSELFCVFEFDVILSAAKDIRRRFLTPGSCSLVVRTNLDRAQSWRRRGSGGGGSWRSLLTRGRELRPQKPKAIRAILSGRGRATQL